MDRFDIGAVRVHRIEEWRGNFAPPEHLLAGCTPEAFAPQPGFSTTTTRSARPEISTSTCPMPTVSSRIHGQPQASSTRTPSEAACASPP